MHCLAIHGGLSSEPRVHQWDQKGKPGNWTGMEVGEVNPVIWYTLDLPHNHLNVDYHRTWFVSKRKPSQGDTSHASVPCRETESNILLHKVRFLGSWRYMQLRQVWPGEKICKLEYLVDIARGVYGENRMLVITQVCHFTPSAGKYIK